MTEQMPDFDPAGTLDLWIPVPRPESLEDPQAWAAEAAAEFCADRELDEDTAPILAQLLIGLAAEPLSPEGDIRLLFLVEPELGGTLWEVGFFRADHDLSLDDLVGSPDASPLGGEVSTFEYLGHAGKQAVHYLLSAQTAAETPDDRAIEAVAVTALTRELGGLELTLVARAHTAHLDSLSISLVPMQYLLASELFAQLVEGPTSDPAGTPA